MFGDVGAFKVGISTFWIVQLDASHKERSETATAPINSGRAIRLGPILRFAVWLLAVARNDERKQKTFDVSIAYPRSNLCWNVSLSTMSSEAEGVAADDVRHMWIRIQMTLWMSQVVFGDLCFFVLSIP